MHFTPRQVANLLRGTRAVLIFGIATSICANVLHSLVRPAAANEPGWKVVSAAALAALAPLVLFACTELVSRIPIQSKTLGGIRLAVTLLVGGFAGWVSYWHMQSIAEILGEEGSAKYFYPLIIDGMMLVATISLIELGRLAHTVERIVSAEIEASKQIDPQVAAKRSEAARKAWETRRQNATGRPTRKRKTKPTHAPVSPAVGPMSEYVETSA